MTASDILLELDGVSMQYGRSETAITASRVGLQSTEIVRVCNRRSRLRHWSKSLVEPVRIHSVASKSIRFPRGLRRYAGGAPPA